MKSEAPKLYRFESSGRLHEALSERIATTLQEAITARGEALLAVSGGNTPKPLFEKLSRIDLPWEKVTVTLVDERWVDPQDDASNEKLVRAHLLQNFAAKAGFVGLKTDDTTPQEGCGPLERTLSTLPLPFDAVILGMGNDGHTASFFPNATALPRALDPQSRKLCYAVTPLNAPHPRMTLTLYALLQSRLLILHIEGAQKLAVLNEAEQPGDVAQMPIRALLRRSDLSLEIYHA